MNLKTEYRKIIKSAEGLIKETKSRKIIKIAKEIIEDSKSKIDSLEALEKFTRRDK